MYNFSHFLRSGVEGTKKPSHILHPFEPTFAPLAPTWWNFHHLIFEEGTRVPKIHDKRHRFNFQQRTEEKVNGSISHISKAFFISQCEGNIASKIQESSLLTGLFTPSASVSISGSVTASGRVILIYTCAIHTKRQQQHQFKALTLTLTLGVITEQHLC